MRTASFVNMPGHCWQTGGKLAAHEYVLSALSFTGLSDTLSAGGLAVVVRAANRATDGLSAPFMAGCHPVGGGSLSSIFTAFPCAFTAFPSASTAFQCLKR